MQSKKLLNYISLILTLSILVSIYLIYLHYSTSPGLCDINQTLSCNTVNKSIYSVFPPDFGIPVSIIGIVFFIILFALSRIVYSNPKKEIKTIKYYFYLSAVALLFSIYLIIIEAFVLHAYCIACLILDLLIIINLIFAYKLKSQTSSSV